MVRGLVTQCLYVAAQTLPGDFRLQPPSPPPRSCSRAPAPATLPPPSPGHALPLPASPPQQTLLPPPGGALHKPCPLCPLSRMTLSSHCIKVAGASVSPTSSRAPLGQESGLRLLSIESTQQRAGKQKVVKQRNYVKCYFFRLQSQELLGGNSLKLQVSW